MTNFLQIQTLQKLNLFSKIDETALQEILRNASVQNFSKDKILFLREEKVINFYILLTGSAKLTISNEEGEEIILRLVEEDQLICDFFAEKFTFDAVIVKDCEILAIPLVFFKKLIAQNLQLLQNILLEVSKQNHELTGRIEELNLGDVKQKIGQFLLSNSFEKKKKRKDFNLKYQKSLIASYFAIKPETLSRALKNLEEEGEILIKKDKIILPKRDSLCKFCNNKIAEKCSDNNSEFCQS